MATKYDTVIDEVLNKFELKDIWSDLLAIEGDDPPEIVAWVEALQLFARNTIGRKFSHEDIMLLAYRNVAVRAMATHEEAEVSDYIEEDNDPDSDYEEEEEEEDEDEDDEPDGYTVGYNEDVCTRLAVPDDAGCTHIHNDTQEPLTECVSCGGLFSEEGMHSGGECNRCHAINKDD